MKTLFSFVALYLLSTTAFAADQILTCHEINKSGSRKANGASLRGEFMLRSDGTLARRYPGTIKLEGFFRRGSSLSPETSAFSLSMSLPNADVQYSHVNWNDANQELVEFQLQFNSRILGRAFRDERASLVVGMEDTGSEDTGAIAGFSLECDSRLQ